MLAAPVQALASPLAEGVWRIGADPLRWEAGRGFAGAISSIRFRGREFLDASDHGRELQGAVQFGAGECLNPTLAGAGRDPPGQSSSQLLSVSAGPTRYYASTRMAYWNRPGAGCTRAPGVRGLTLNPSEVSDLVYTQDMTPGYQGHANAILARIRVETPRVLPPASVEALTAYMPPDFNTFILYDRQSGGFRPDSALDLQSAEGDDPLILSTAEGRSAMGVISVSGAAGPRYAGFHSAAVGKWSLVYHENKPFWPGVHRYACVWIIGTRREVEDSLAAVAHRSAAEATAGEALWVGAAIAALLLGAGLLVARERRRRDRPLSPL